MPRLTHKAMRRSHTLVACQGHHFLTFQISLLNILNKEVGRGRKRKEMVMGKRVTLFKKKPLEITLCYFSSFVCVRSQKINTVHSQGRELPNGRNQKESWWKGAHLRGCHTRPVWSYRRYSLPLPLCHLGHVNHSSTSKMWLNSETRSLVCE